VNRDSTFFEKLALLALSGLSVVSLTWIALAAMKLEGMDPNAATLIGGIATGLVAFSKDIVTAIRGYTMSAQLGKVTDQLAASGPAADLTAVQPVKVMNAPDDPVPTTEGEKP
jgi:hypothetical protein